jgi:hypothetical protein
MTEGQPAREGDRLAAGQAQPASEIPMIAALTGDEEDDEALGGDPVCWAYLVCEECGAITTEGHRAGCSAAAPR